MKAALILALIALLVPPANQKHNGEDEDDARARYAVIADAIADETSDKTLVLFLLTVARHESTFTRKVHSGEVRGDAGYAWSLFQLNIGSRKASAKIPKTDHTLGSIIGVDADSTRRSVEAASVYLRPAIKRCRARPRCVFMTYGGLTREEARKPKRKKQLDARVATYRRLVAKTRPKK